MGFLRKFYEIYMGIRMDKGFKYGIYKGFIG